MSPLLLQMLPCQKRLHVLVLRRAQAQDYCRDRQQSHGFSRLPPQVAVSLSNLAILHNQRGEFAQAQPLYERALAIFEMNFGPFNANVAHTLTDLAVLHLEQVGSLSSSPRLTPAQELLVMICRNVVL